MYEDFFMQSKQVVCDVYTISVANVSLSLMGVVVTVNQGVRLFLC